MTVKPIMFQDQFWRDLQASHKAALERVAQNNAVTASVDAVILQVSSEFKEIYAAYEKGCED
jgi:isochorismate hydrolase